MIKKDIKEDIIQYIHIICWFIIFICLGILLNKLISNGLIPFGYTMTNVTNLHSIGNLTI